MTTVAGTGQQLRMPFAVSLLLIGGLTLACNGTGPAQPATNASGNQPFRPPGTQPLPLPPPPDPSEPVKPGIADRPVIMTGGSFHVWSAGEQLTHTGVSNGVHTYMRTNGNAEIRRIRVWFPVEAPRPCQPRPHCTHGVTIGVDLWYRKAMSEPPDISLRGGTMTIDSGAANPPLVYSGLGSVPYEGGNIQAHRYDHAEEQSMSFVRVWQDQTRYYDYTFSSENRPRIQVHYQ